ncbi:citrate (pro-3S)-lyase subunit beta [Acinetobacter puyangensis]|uniref:Citrate lyase subunit beta / citryl-CoA lyase n=1 Tax=Acinetobacter puyangensis TaxID=1096779 RepID=A0A240ECA5_9GAMM|nr:aldolase/citrate lyase family protein [Acinetobacter puyangensis]SNX46181.1 citrate lyase subunit beta / citryl-CoA lyase [Acinetobacter puyangensis]
MTIFITKNPIEHVQVYIAVRGNEPENFEAAYRSGADAVVFDLDKPVPVEDKVKARNAVAEFLQIKPALPTLVRINGPDTPFTQDDLAMIIQPGVSALRLPRVESSIWIRDIAQIVELKRQQAGIIPTIGLEVYPGTAKGLINVLDLANATHTIWRLGLAEESLYQSIQSSTDQAMLLARLQVVQASQAFGLTGPVQKSFVPHWSDEYMYESSLLGLQLGYTARTVWKAEHVAIWKQAYHDFIHSPIRTQSGLRKSI